ncbi:MAG TPA: restriction endonuclease subunit S [Bacteroidales bacterium]|jgi:type I restriction enzyme S subunit|nr:restriction endonuclease subunit S [Bacteroidales bacterium]HOG57121.1 restriction endonuclease subunit S [Bacteroidales bacterium]
MSKDNKLVQSKGEGLIPELRFPGFLESWQISSIGDVCKVYRGSALLKSDINNNNGSEPCIHYGELFTKYDEVITKIYSKTDKCEGFRSEIGDILMPSSDVTPDGLAKASAIMIKNIILGGDINILRPKININSIFLSYLINYYKSEIIKLVSGTTVKHIYPDQIITSRLPIVNNLLEQQKIASCLSSLDEAIEAHSQKLDLLKEHKKGLMQNLFPQEGETVPKLRFKEFEKDGEWITKQLDELCKLVRGPFGNALKKEIFVKEGYAVYEQSHAIYSDFSSFRYYIKEDKFSELKRFCVMSGDLIMSCSGTMGKFAIIPQDYKDGVINQALLKLTVKKGYDNLFIKTTLETENIQNNLLLQSAGGAIKNVVSVSRIKELELLVPSIKEQQKISSCLSSLDELITAQAEKIEHLKLHKKGLMQGLFPKMNN